MSPLAGQWPSGQWHLDLRDHEDANLRIAKLGEAVSLTCWRVSAILM